MTTDNAPEVVAELDRLNEVVKAAPAGDSASQIALWQQVCRLEYWFFIARGSADRPRPYSVATEQGPMTCLYSSAAGANEAAISLGVAPDSGAVPLFGVPMPDAIDYVAAFDESGVVGVVLDHPRIGHHIPLANLSLLKGWIEGATQ